MLTLTNSATADPLLTPLASAPLRLPNRIAMAPMTRGRADGDGVPHDLTTAYYVQRASAGLLISEGLWPHVSGRGGPGVPGIATAAQTEKWRQVTTAVHAAGGRIYAQLWHVGRLAHPRDLPTGLHPLAPSAIAAPEKVFTADGWVDAVAPEALTLDGVDAVIRQYAEAARNAISAGFDGVELHSANGYLLHQFLSDNANQRTDGYGGSGRTRIVREVVDALVAAVGADRVAVRFSPGNPDNGLVEADPATTYGPLVRDLDRLGLSYLHVIERGKFASLPAARSWWSGLLVGNVDGSEPSTPSGGRELLKAGLVDVVAMGRLFIANPDLPLRIATGAPLATPRSDDFYGSQLEGYADHPAIGTGPVVPQLANVAS
ncbi:alkene reductase [Kribbella deserti]|uniref:Alkene reductase n=1 Tax=Kribbella deserti TaxID=1926257 RepID=A0ABV6QZ50_9ACTN